MRDKKELADERKQQWLKVEILRKKGEAFYICSTEADITGQGFVKR